MLDGSFDVFRRDFLTHYRTTDETTRLDQKQRWLQAKRDKT